MKKYAIIDIGSNSVRLMLWADGKVLFKKLRTTRLGAGVSQSGVLCEGSIEASVKAISEFSAEARGENAEVYAFATAAVRSANNGGDFCEQVKRACGLEVDVVSGETEALLGITGALKGSDGGIIDVGGNSTEVVARKGGKITFSVSLPLGAVRLLDECRDEISLLDRVIDERIFPLKKSGGTSFFAIGGTASALACLATERCGYSPDLNGTSLSAEFIEKTAIKLLSMSKEERLNVKGMEKARADVIAGGAYLIGKIMRKLSVTEIAFSDADNLEGYLYYKILNRGEQTC